MNTEKAPPAPQVWPLFAEPQQRGAGEDVLQRGNRTTFLFGKQAQHRKRPVVSSPQTWGAGGATLLLLLLLLYPARAQNPRPIAPSGPPDVLVLVFAVPGGADQIGLTYAGKVPRAQVQRDMAALKQNTGWALTAVKITDSPPPVAGKRPAMTSAECAAVGVVDGAAHTLPLEPIVRALKPYHRVTLSYFAPPGFQFQGLRGFADEHVQIALMQHGATYTYNITITDPHFDRLNLPLYGLPSAGLQSAQGQPGAARRRPNPLLVGLTLAAALGAGGVVYFVLARGAR